MACHRHHSVLVGLLALPLLAATFVSLSGPGSESPVPIRFPDPDIGVDSLPARKKTQPETVNQFKVFYQFQFVDKVRDNGITFVQHIEEDAGRHHKPVHYDGKSGYLSQSALPFYFGLGDAKEIDRVEVHWPSGRKQVVTQGLQENQTIRITETK